jgi:hypothetical protein
MSFRGWGGSIATAIGVAAGAGAAQLGIGYGLGVFSWLPTVHDVDEAAWLASLAWTVWIAALSVVLGTLVAERSGVSTADWTLAARTLWRVALAIAAALGGLIVVALTAVPARAAQRADTFAPHLIVGGYAIAGVLLGVFVAVAAVTARAVTANLLATGAWLWLLATVATVDSLAAGRNVGVSQLGAWSVTEHGPWFRSLYLPGAGISAAAALLIGVLAAWPSARQGGGRLGIALSGAAGPALVAAAYLLAAPKLVNVLPEQLSAHLVAPYAVLTGLIGSVVVALLARPAGYQPAVEKPTTVPDEPATAVVIPTQARPPADPAPVKAASGVKASAPVKAAAPAQSNAPVQSNPPVQSNAPVQSNPPVQSNAPVQSNPPVQNKPVAQSIPAQSPAVAKVTPAPTPVKQGKNQPTGSAKPGSPG